MLKVTIYILSFFGWAVFAVAETGGVLEWWAKPEWPAWLVPFAFAGIAFDCLYLAARAAIDATRNP